MTPGTADDPFAADTFGTPDRNPWNALLRLTGFDFLPNGERMAVCTGDGDVWAVAVNPGRDARGDTLAWQRIASGPFQPLELKVRDGSIVVCCRDQIVKLHDLNGDGETEEPRQLCGEGRLLRQPVGYTDITDSSDSAMKPPLCWNTNAGSGPGKTVAGRIGVALPSKGGCAAIRTPPRTWS